jgi:hypothetical protein
VTRGGDSAGNDALDFAVSDNGAAELLDDADRLVPDGPFGTGYSALRIWRESRLTTQQLRGGTGCQFGAQTPSRIAGAGTFLVGFRPFDGHAKPFRTTRDVVDIESYQLGRPAASGTPKSKMARSRFASVAIDFGNDSALAARVTR